MTSSGFIDLFVVDNPEGNRPHFKGFVKLADGTRLEFGCWPSKSGKPGVFDGRLKPAQERAPAGHDPAPRYGGHAPADPDDSIPF